MVEMSSRMQHTTIGNALFDCLAEVASRFDSCDIHKYFLLAEVSNQVVKQTTSLSFTLRSSPAYRSESLYSPGSIV
jgi:hypothetical protein